MIEGIEALCEWMRDHANPYYKIYYGSKGLQVLAYNDTTNDIEQAIERMRKSFNGFAEGRYFIQCKATLEASSNKGLPETIYIHSKTSSPSINGAPSAPSPIVDIQAEIARALNEYKRDQEIERLKAELAEKNALIRELEGNSFGNRIGRVIEIMEPYIPKLMEKNGINAAPTRVAVAGAAPQAQAHGAQQVQEDGQRLTEALERWAQADPEGYLNAIEELSRFAESDPSGYAKARPYLGKLSNLVSFL